MLALALFQQNFYEDVAENLVGALEGLDEAIPNKSSFTRARQRLGAGVLEAVFRKLAAVAGPCPRRRVPAGSATREKGHGRTETRTLKAAHVSGPDFPHARQAIKITRQAVYAVTSLTGVHAT